MKNDITIDQLKARRRALEDGIVDLIETYAGFTGNRPEIKVDRILVINEGRRSFKYEVKIK